MMALFNNVRQREADAAAEQRGKPENGVRASAMRLQLGNRKILKKQVVGRQNWQEDAWGYFDEIGEIKYPIRLVGNVLSKLRFFIAVRPADNPEGDPIPASDTDSGIPIELANRAEAELERLKSPLGGRAEIVRMLMMNLEIAGECYLVCIGPRITTETDSQGVLYETVTEESWEIKSIDEVITSRDGKEVKIVKQPGDQNPDILDDTKGDVLIRIWQRHPRFSYLPDNAMRGALSVAESLMLLENQVKATAKSHASAGVILFPNEFEQAWDEKAGQSADEDEYVPSFREAFDEALLEPIQKPDSVASVAPLPLFAPNEYLPNVRHLNFVRPTDAGLDARIEGRVLRLARALNFPAEVTLGHQQTTFANAAVIDQDTFTDHYEPMAILISDSWTVGFLHQNLIDAGEDPNLVNRLLVWYDPGPLLRGVEPHETAREGWDIGAISDEAWRRVNGWTEEDAPDPIERLLRSVMKLRTLDPGLSTAIFELLGVPLDIPTAVPAGPRQDPNVPPAPPDEDSGGPGPGDTPAPPTQSLTRPPQTLSEALLLFLLANRRSEQPAIEVTSKINETATPEVVRAARARYDAQYGRQLMEIDRDLRTKLQMSAHSIMQDALRIAGNKIKGRASSALSSKKRNAPAALEIVRNVAPRYAAQHLGPALVAATGYTHDDLLPRSIWQGLHQQWNSWVPAAQSRAVNIVAKIVPLLPGRRAALADKQARARDAAWVWLEDELQALAERLLYQPDPTEPPRGEFENISVPASLVRQAVARAGGASGIHPPPRRVNAAANANDLSRDTYVALNNGDPLGGIGLGEDMQAALDEGGADTQAWIWDYGPAFRKFPFEDHEALDGVQFADFDSPELDASSSWVDSANFYPGDHDGCCCDVIPIILGPGDIAFNEATGEGFYTGQQPFEEGGEEQYAITDPKVFDAAQAAKFETTAADEQFQPILEQVQTLHGLPTDQNSLLVDKAKELTPKIVGNRYSNGQYNRDTHTITIRSLSKASGNGQHEAFNFVHEYGHALDDAVVGNISEFATKSAMLSAGGTEDLWNAVVEFRQAVQDSDAFRILKEVDTNPRWIQYATSSNEAWARAYSQYVAEQIGGDVEAGLKYVQSKWPGLQWEGEDFTKVRASVEKILDARGLVAKEAEALAEEPYPIPKQILERGFAEGKAFMVSEDGMVDVYHATTRELADQIEQSGVLRQGQRLFPLTSDPNTAIDVARQSPALAGKDPVIMHFRMSTEDAERLLTTGDVKADATIVNHGLVEKELSTQYLSDTKSLQDIDAVANKARDAERAATEAAARKAVEEAAARGMGVPSGEWRGLEVRRAPSGLPHAELGGRRTITKDQFTKDTRKVKKDLQMTQTVQKQAGTYKATTARGIAERMEHIDTKTMRSMLQMPDTQVSRYENARNMVFRVEARDNGLFGSTRIVQDLTPEVRQDLLKFADETGKVTGRDLQRFVDSYPPGYNTFTDQLRGELSFFKTPDELDRVSAILGDTRASRQIEREDYVSQLVHHWAITANDSDAVSLAVQDAAKSVFNLQNTYDWTPNLSGSTAREAELLYQQNKVGFDAYVRAMYDNTQQALRAAGYGPNDPVPLVRGQKGLRYGQGIGPQDLRPMSSFTLNQNTALQFAGRNYGTAFYAEVPASWIIGFPGYGVGCLNEYEIVVLGGRVEMFAAAGGL